MPIYVYRCQKCGAVEEHIQRFSDAPKSKCESCGGRLAKQVTSAAFHLKGGGWYKDGYASNKPEAATTDAGSGSGSDGGGDGGGSDKSASPTADSGSTKPAKADAVKAKSEAKVKASGEKAKAKPKKAGSG